jgi:ribosomal protein S4
VLQVKQKINHGHISINGKKVTFPNFRLKSQDKVMLKGFIENPL